jgi:hypothetical protein
MPSYVRLTLENFINAHPDKIVGRLQTAYALDGYRSQIAQQSLAWAYVIPLLQSVFQQVLNERSDCAHWSVLLEYPLYRLQRRIDLVVLAGPYIIVIESKVGETTFRPDGIRQVEEYALDLRDFHSASRLAPILPVLWCTEAREYSDRYIEKPQQIPSTYRVNTPALISLLKSLPGFDGRHSILGEAWDKAQYRPVPNVIQAATSIFAGHDVRAITQADASNLKDAAKRLVELISTAKQEQRHYLLFLTGVPGSGKTLAGLYVVHDSIATGREAEGDIVYLSGNTPLVTVLREALARDDYQKAKQFGRTLTLKTARRSVRTRIQHINDFLKEYLGKSGPPHEHAIVFDEAQRAWDQEQGKKKFDRRASEPTLLLELMSRHPDWSACVCLVGGGQEINSGEKGVVGWGEALRLLRPEALHKWTICAPREVLDSRGGPSTGGLSIGELPTGVRLREEPTLQLLVPLRSFRSPALADWVRHVLNGDAVQAHAVSQDLGSYPLFLTRSLQHARKWLLLNTRGERRSGLLASSGARRLRADGLGVTLHANDGPEIANWYLNPPGDIRSSFALEVPANQYTCQGLELDFSALCWGGDLVRKSEQWIYQALGGTTWTQVRNRTRRQFIENSYRVLMTRAREGMIIWVPVGDERDSTRDSSLLDATADFLNSCGAKIVGG